jgi:hypothetical protein
MKNRFLLLAGLLSAGISNVHATEYVCELSLVPPVAGPTLGTSGYISMYTSPAPKCTGGTTEKFICSKGATSNVCGVNAQYSEASLVGVYESLRNAQALQQQIVMYWNACIGGGGSCTGGAMLYAYS